MHLSVHVLDVPAFVLVTTPSEVVVVVPTHLDSPSLEAVCTLLLSAKDRAALERMLCEHGHTPSPRRFPPEQDAM